ncbi:MAG TPA: hypothetical protein VFV07_12240, partial [Rhizomicrobium sp.]|nr:hypothetical protein [Rhizomicrobium sp.]
MRNPTAYELALGRFIRAKLGDDTKVVRYGDDDERYDAFVVSGKNCPCEGVTSYASVGLSRREQHSGDV